MSRIFLRFFVVIFVVANLASTKVIFGQQRTADLNRNRITAQPPITRLPNTRLSDAMNELAADIRDTRLLLSGVQNRSLRQKLKSLLSRAEGNLAVIQTELVLGEASTVILTDAAFQELLNSVKQQSFSSKKSTYIINYVKLTAASTDRLSSAQVKQLLSTIDFDKDRVPAAIALFQITSDRQNFLKALDAISFDTNRKAVQAQLGLRK